MNDVSRDIQNELRAIEASLGARLYRWHEAQAGWAIAANELTAVAHTPGKRIRPRLLLICNGMCGGAAGPAVRDVAEALELYHGTSLLYDDVQDNAQTRRGEPAHHTTYGVSATLSLCALLSRHVNRILLESEALSPPARLWILRRLTRAQLDIGLGQMAETAWVRDDVLDLPVARYWRMIEDKTAALFAFAAEAGAYLGSGGDETLAAAYRDVGNRIGILFQLVDDYADLFQPDTGGKPRGQDIREAKRTIFLLHARQALPAEDRRELDRLCLRAERTEEEVRWIHRQMRASGAQEMGLGHVHRLESETREQIDGLARRYAPDPAFAQEIRTVVDEICRGIG